MSQTKIWKATDKQLETFIEKTSLIPVIVLDGVVSELADFLKEEGQVDVLYEMLRNDETASYIEGRSALVYENNAEFRKALKARDPRPFYYSFVRHWISGVVKVKFPALFSKLPRSFAMGAPLAL